jgi:hypothetical protein
VQVKVTRGKQALYPRIKKFLHQQVTWRMNHHHRFFPKINTDYPRLQLTDPLGTKGFIHDDLFTPEECERLCRKATHGTPLRPQIGGGPYCMWGRCSTALLVRSQVILLGSALFFPWIRFGHLPLLEDSRYTRWCHILLHPRRTGLL